MVGRAERRAERERIKAKRLRRVPWIQLAVSTAHDSGRVIGRAIDTATPCSCEMCGNPRRYFGDRTVQERRHGWY